MRQRLSFGALAGLASIAISMSACGDAGSTTTTELTRSYPTDPDVALVRIGHPDGQPTIVIGGDGWVYYPAELLDAPTMAPSVALGALARSSAGRAPQAVPTPPAPTPVDRRNLTPDGVRIMLDLADDLGLLAIPADYEDPGITDVGSTYVTLTDGDGTYEHDAYALGIEEETGNRKNLLDFVEAIAGLEGLVGVANLGPAEPYFPAVFRVSVVAGSYADDYETVWPADVPVEEGCVELPTGGFAAGVAGLYVADIDGVETRVSVTPDLPGDSCA